MVKQGQSIPDRALCESTFLRCRHDYRVFCRYLYLIEIRLNATFSSHQRPILKRLERSERWNDWNHLNAQVDQPFERSSTWNYFPSNMCKFLIFMVYERE